MHQPGRSFPILADRHPIINGVSHNSVSAAYFGSVGIPPKSPCGEHTRDRGEAGLCPIRHRPDAENEVEPQKSTRRESPFSVGVRSANARPCAERKATLPSAKSASLPTRAGTTCGNDLTLVTNNTQEFAQAPGLC